MAREVTVTDQAIDPELRPIIEAQRLRALARPALTAVTPPEMRVRAAAEFAPWNEAPEPVAEVRDLVAGKIPARLYRPHDEGSSGLLVYAGGAETESYRAFADGRYGLPRAAMDWFWRTYAGPDLLAAAVDAVPLKANLVGLPPTFLNYAELDILRDDSVHLADRLRGAGVDVVAREYAGAVHGFTQYSKASALARRALDDAGDALEAALG